MRFCHQPTCQTTSPSLLRLAVLAFAFASVCSSTIAQTRTPDFRIESQVYVDEGQKPVSQNVTLFADGIVYDFQMDGGSSSDPSEIVIFDERKRELILMDISRKLAWTVADLRLLKMLDQMRRETVNNDKTNFLVNQSFTETSDWSSDVVSLESNLFSYLLKGKRPDEETILIRYYDFLDQFTRLSASDPKRIPPFPRLKLNQTIKSHGWIPTEVQVSVKANTFFKEPFSATSKHVLVMSLSDADSERIAFARKCWFEFEQCSLSEYRQIALPTKRLALRSDSAASDKAKKR